MYSLKELGKLEVEDINKYHKLKEYYDSYTGNVCIPLPEFLNNSLIRKEAFSLLGSKSLVSYNACWTMTRALIGDEDGELIPGVVIRTAIDFLV